MDFLTNLSNFYHSTGFANISGGNILMMVIAFIFLYLAIVKDYEPLLLVPIGFGVLVGNIPPISGMALGVHEQGSVFSYLYKGVMLGIYPPLIFNLIITQTH